MRRGVAYQDIFRFYDAGGRHSVAERLEEGIPMCRIPTLPDSPGNAVPLMWEVASFKSSLPALSTTTATDVDETP